MSVLIITMMVVVLVVPVGLVLYYRWTHRDRLNFNQIKPKHIEHEVRFYGRPLIVTECLLVLMLLGVSLGAAIYGVDFFNSVVFSLLFIPAFFSVTYSQLLFNRWKHYLGFEKGSRELLDSKRRRCIDILTGITFIPVALVQFGYFFNLGIETLSVVYFSFIPLLAWIVIMSIANAKFSMNFRNLFEIDRDDDGNYEVGF